MNDFLISLYDSLGLVAATLLAASISFLGLVIAKENKVSEFRQVWIDALRNDIAEYIASVRVIAQGHMRRDALDQATNEKADFSLRMNPTYLSSSVSLAKIRLRLNPDDPDKRLRHLNAELLDQVTKIQNFLGSAEYKQALQLTNTLHEYASPILKLEWERVKNGERVYRISRWIALFLILSFLTLFIWGLLQGP